MKGLVIIAKQRSGTNFLRSLLAQSSNGCNLGEVFHPGTPEGYGNFFTWMRQTGRDFPMVRELPWVEDTLGAWLDDIEARYPVPILDIKYNSFWAVATTWVSVAERPALFKVLNARGYRFVHLIRENRLDHAMSIYIAARSGVYVSHKDVENAERYDVNVRNLLRIRETYEDEIAHARKVLSHMRRPTEVTYEGLTGADRPELRRTLRQMVAGTDIEIGQVGAPTTRKILKNWRDNVSNLDEVERAFASA